MAPVQGDDTNCPFLRLGLYPRLVLALMHLPGRSNLNNGPSSNPTALRRCCPEAAATAMAKIIIGEEWRGTYLCRARWAMERACILLPIVHLLHQQRTAPFPWRRRNGGRHGPQVWGDVMRPLVLHVEPATQTHLFANRLC